jgi:hypothetical protein
VCKTSPVARFYTTALDFSQTSPRVYIRLCKHGKRFLFVKYLPGPGVGGIVVGGVMVSKDDR